MKAVVMSGGEGANYNYADYGQNKGNPPSTDPDMEGGSLRAQDLRAEPEHLRNCVGAVDPVQEGVHQACVVVQIRRDLEVAAVDVNAEVAASGMAGRSPMIASSQLCARCGCEPPWPAP